MTNTSVIKSTVTPGQSGRYARTAVPRGTVLWFAFERRTALNEARWVKRSTGFDVAVVGSVDEAKRLCEEQAPVALVVEFELADSDGVTALSELRKRDVRAPAVLISATEEMALAALVRSGLQEAVPVLPRAERHPLLRDWFEQLETCCLVAGF